MPVSAAIPECAAPLTPVATRRPLLLLRRQDRQCGLSGSLRRGGLTLPRRRNLPRRFQSSLRGRSSPGLLLVRVLGGSSLLRRASRRTSAATVRLVGFVATSRPRAVAPVTAVRSITLTRAARTLRVVGLMAPTRTIRLRSPASTRATSSTGGFPSAIRTWLVLLGFAGSSRRSFEKVLARARIRGNDLLVSHLGDVALPGSP